MSQPTMSPRELRNTALSRRAATQGMVLLHNAGAALPIPTSGSIALYGIGAARTVRGGTGSGDPFNGGLSGGGDAFVNQSPRYHINILDAFESAGYDVVTAPALRQLAADYDAAMGAAAIDPMRTFAFPEPALTPAQTGGTATAVYVLSRNAGEGADRRMKGTVEINGVTCETGDYQLSATEKANLQLLRATFPTLILVLNVGGPVAMDELLAIEPDAMLLMSQAGQEGATALLDVLTGKVNPSGKLTATWAMQYSDNPTSATFAYNDGDVSVERYTEGIYVGYRYFDTFGIQPAFPFGFGLSYTTFALSDASATLADETLHVHVRVVNTGDVAGREVAQVYVSAPETVLEMPAQELRGFAKTRELAPGASETLDIAIPLRRLASYSEAQEAYLLSSGDYRIRLGVSSRDTAPLCILRVAQTWVTERVYTELPLSQPLEEWSHAGRTAALAEGNWDNVPVLALTMPPETFDCRSPYHDGHITTYTTDPDYRAVLPYETVELVEKRTLQLADVRSGKARMADFVAQLTIAQLAQLNCGTGWGVADEHNPVVGGSSESVPGAAGETLRDYEDTLGIPSLVVADGPGGVRVAQSFEATDVITGKKRMCYHFCTAWPIGTLLAQSFDPALIEEVGRGFAEELAELRIAILLGPGINIHRDPLCGRNFEYFSEDPLVAGIAAAAMVRGVQSMPGIGACIKHYAANNQESNRNAVDTIIGQRALREIYLKPFEIAVKESQPMSIMTSYNLINGVPTADSFDLCTDLARGEWGFRGLIMTDWNGGSSTPWISMHAGNDLIMPGGASRSLNIRLAAETVLPLFDERGQVSMLYDNPMIPTLPTAQWNSFRLDPAGTDTIVAPIDSSHTCSIENGELHVDGQPLYTATGSIRDLFRDRAHFQPLVAPATTAVAAFTDEGVVYRGYLDRTPRICLGDLQRCAMHNLAVAMGSIAMRRTNPELPLTPWTASR